jgi:hypothetical protein
MTTEPLDADQGEATPLAATVGLFVAFATMALVCLIAPIRDRYLLAISFTVLGLITAIVVPLWYRPRP